VDCSKRLVEETAAAGARLVFMSTDQVFDGETGGYVETSAPHPLNLYGRLKAEMECHVLSERNGIVARTGWNVGWEQGQHCAVSQAYETLLLPGARMAADNVFNVTDVDDTARGLFALAADNLPPRHIYHLVSTPEVSRAALAHIIRATSRWGLAMEFAIVPFASITYTEPRPTRAFLYSESLADLSLEFARPEDVIRRKVALLDRWRLEAGAAPPRPEMTFPKNPVSDTTPQ
jgi:dTDP-4-dehydrorhamnose reductase